MLENTEIIIMTRNRPEMVSRMIDSILPIKNKIGSLWISDNSTTKQTYDLLKNKYPSLTSIKREDISVWEHYQNIVSEITLPFCIILHDDDYILDSMSSAIEGIGKTACNLDACGFNGYLIINGEIQSEIYHSPKKELAIQKNTTIIENWIAGNNSHPPFPAFLYKSSSLKKAFEILKDLKESRVNDAALIYIISSFGKVAYSNRKILAYEIHGENDTHYINTRDWINLKLNYKKLTKSKYDYGLMTIRDKYLLSRFNYAKYPKSSSTIIRYKMKCILKNPLHHFNINKFESFLKFCKIYCYREVFMKYPSLQATHKKYH